MQSADIEQDALIAPSAKNSCHRPSPDDGSSPGSSEVFFNGDTQQADIAGSVPTADTPELKSYLDLSGVTTIPQFKSKFGKTPVSVLNELLAGNLEAITYSAENHTEGLSQFMTAAVFGCRKYYGLGMSKKESKHAAAMAVLLTAHKQPIPPNNSSLSNAFVACAPAESINSDVRRIASGKKWGKPKTPLSSLTELCKFSCKTHEEKFSGRTEYHASLTVRGNVFSGCGPSKKASMHAAAVVALDKVFHMQYADVPEDIEAEQHPEARDVAIAQLCSEKFAEFWQRSSTCDLSKVRYSYAGIVMRSVEQLVVDNTGMVHVGHVMSCWLSVRACVRACMHACVRACIWVCGRVCGYWCVCACVC